MSPPLPPLLALPAQCGCWLLPEERFRALMPRLAYTVPAPEWQLALQTVLHLELPTLLPEACLTELCTALAQTQPQPVGSQTPLSPEHEALLHHLQPWLAWATLQQYLQTEPAIRLEAVGAVLRQDADFAALTGPSLLPLLGAVSHRVTAYAHRLQQWLHRHAQHFPCWQAANNCRPNLPAAGLPWGSAG